MWNMENMKNEKKYMGNKGIMWNLGKEKGKGKEMKKWDNENGKENKKKWKNKGKGKWMWTWKGMRKNDYVWIMVRGIWK